MANHLDYKNSETASSFQIVFLCIWIISFTVGLDILSEFKLYDILFLLALIFFHGRITSLNWQEDRSLLWLRRFLIIFIFGTIVSLFSERYLGMTVIGLRLFRLMGYIWIFFIIRSLWLSKKQLSILLGSIFWVIIFQSLLILLQSTGKIPTLWPEKEQYYGIVHTGTLALNHLNPVLFISVAISASCSRLFLHKTKNIFHLIFFAISILIMIAAMMISMARSAIMAMAIFSICSVIFYKKKAIILILLSLILLIPLQKMSGINIVDQIDELWYKRVEVKIKGDIDSIGDVDAQRTAIWSNTISELIAHPSCLIFGTGFQNFAYLKEAKATSAHQLYLHVLAELGIGGLIIFCFFWISIKNRLKQLGRIGGVTMDSLTYPGYMIILAILVIGLVADTFYPARALPGFMGFLLAYLALITHRSWSDEPQRVEPCIISTSSSGN